MRKFKNIPDSELQIMLAIWAAGKRVSTGEIIQILEKQTGRKFGLSLVQQYLGRLVGKKILQCEKIGKFNYYTALTSQDEYSAQEASSFLQKLFENSPTKLFAALIQNQSLSNEEIEELKRLLEKEGGE